MITEDYISFDIAKLLKDKGFDADITTYRDYFIQNGNIVISLQECLSKDRFKTPTLQMAMKWLREVHNLKIYPNHDNFQEQHNWWFGIYKFSKGYSDFIYESDSIYPTYEESCEAAVKYCLENLI